MNKRIAIQGIEGSFHHLAATHLEGETQLRACSDFPTLIGEVASGTVDGGVMAIENSLAGGLVSNYQLLLKEPLFITGEVTVKVQQHLLVRPGIQLEDLEEVQSHPVALFQCHTFLENLGVAIVESADTAASARDVAASDRLIGAIGSRLAADLYGLEVLRENVQTNPDNHTRFIRLDRERSNEGHKFSVYFEVADQVGTLVDALQFLASRGANLQSVHSMPLPRTEWEYGFFVDFEHDEGMELMMQLEEVTHAWRFLGQYHKGEKIWG